MIGCVVTSTVMCLVEDVSRYVNKNVSNFFLFLGSESSGEILNNNCVMEYQQATGTLSAHFRSMVSSTG